MYDPSVTVTKELSSIASANQVVSPRRVRFSHNHGSPHSFITCQKFVCGVAEGAGAVVVRMLYTARATCFTVQMSPTSSATTSTRERVQKLGRFAYSGMADGV